MTGRCTSDLTLAERLRRLDWDALVGELDEHGYALTQPVLQADECDRLIALFGEERHFRSTVNMSQVRFGSGIYRYFAHPLPQTVGLLREHCYPPLAELANRWAQQLRLEPIYPSRLCDFLDLCRRHGQLRPTPILFRYRSGDHNALHQDLYGEIAFPLQIVIVLSRHECYSGGQFVLTTQRPRAQSLVDVIDPVRGQLLIFPNRDKPARSRVSGRHHRTRIRHGVSRLRSGERYSLGIIFHDAR